MVKFLHSEAILRKPLSFSLKGNTMPEKELLLSGSTTINIIHLTSFQALHGCLWFLLGLVFVRDALLEELVNLCLGKKVFRRSPIGNQVFHINLELLLLLF